MNHKSENDYVNNAEVGAGGKYNDSNLSDGYPFDRKTLASIAEIILSLLILAAIIQRNFLFVERPIYNYALHLIAAISSLDALAVAVLTFLNVVAFIIYRETFAVRLVSGFFGLQPNNLDRNELLLNQKVLTSADIVSRSPESPLDVLFKSYIQRSRQAATSAQRRPSGLLFIGATIAVLGLAFFVLTLPGSGSAFQITIASDKINDPINIYQKLVDGIPRLLMLLFIQVLAGFFLRQYRSSMEEFRYYEAILRRREAQFVSLHLRRELADQKALTKFAELILAEQEFGILKSKETTAIMQAHREEANEFGSLVDRVFDLRKLLMGSNYTRLRRVKRKAGRAPNDHL